MSFKGEGSYGGDGHSIIHAAMLVFKYINDDIDAIQHWLPAVSVCLFESIAAVAVWQFGLKWSAELEIAYHVAMT
ncbi:hypothetical protein TgHK011_000895 [Trichoderma gracile]|nr:hypothetical protein TgHK011_000895 [Trichoderma gracile]